MSLHLSTRFLAAILVAVACLASSGGWPALTSAQAARDRREALVESGRVILEPPGRAPVTVRAEIARTRAETRRGLMFRRRMDADAGMLFLFDRPRRMSFWMRNTLISLDMIFITGEQRVLGVVDHAMPGSEEPHEVEGFSQFVLEVNAGFARANGIVPGTVVRFEDVRDVPPPGIPDEDDDDDEYVEGGVED